MERYKAIRFSFDGSTYTARATAGQSPIQAVSLARRVDHAGNVELMWSDRGENYDVYTAKWYDDVAEIFRDTLVKVYRAG